MNILDSLPLFFNGLLEVDFIALREKYYFGKSQLNYRRYLIDSKTLRPEGDNVQAIVNIPPFRNVSSIGTASWY